MARRKYDLGNPFSLDDPFGLDATSDLDRFRIEPIEDPTKDFELSLDDKLNLDIPLTEFEKTEYRRLHGMLPNEPVDFQDKLNQSFLPVEEKVMKGIKLTNIEKEEWDRKYGPPQKENPLDIALSDPDLYDVGRTVRSGTLQFNGPKGNYSELFDDIRRIAGNIEYNLDHVLESKTIILLSNGNSINLLSATQTVIEKTTHLALKEENIRQVLHNVEYLEDRFDLSKIDTYAQVLTGMVYYHVFWQHPAESQRNKITDIANRVGVSYNKIEEYLTLVQSLFERAEK